ncbi:MAG: Clp protease N-terminal domain-containing protein [Mycobacterium sp.]|nr:Clp protease N-terminal domain-containing protein [Mycobacterium sp.]
MTTTGERDTSVTTITGWTPVGTHLLLTRAAEIARAHGHRFVGDEHLTTAMLQAPHSFLRRLFGDDDSTALTFDELTARAAQQLPPPTPEHIGPDPDMLTVHTEWAGPHAEEIRAQLARP